MARLAERAVHEALWLGGRAVLRTGRRRSPPSPGVRYLTSVVRVPGEVAAALAPALERLRALDSHHCYYAPEQLHVTVANLDGLRVPLERVERVLASAPPLSLAARGLGLSPGTVLVRMEPLGDELLGLRRRLRPLAPAPGLGGALLRQIAFANVVRFAGTASRAFVGEVARLRGHELGAWTAGEVEIVRTDRLLSPEATEILARIPLGTGG
jgi:hypothetical protein